MSKYWTLDDKGKPTPCADIITYAAWLENNQERVIGQTKIGDAEISTVFLGIDHNFTGGAPLLFETMIFGGKHDEYQERYSTREQAEAGHARVVECIKNGVEP